jgi:DHA1 family tetracycline resistance protein-like MFS transporter
MQFLATPLLGELSDRYGRKPVLAISLLGTCISYVLFGIGIHMRSIVLLFVSRAFDGITGGNIAVAQAAIADVSTPENRAKNFGLIGAAFGMGFILGPYIGGKLSDPGFISWFNAATPFWFAAILSFLNVLSVVFLLPETLKNKGREVHIHLAKSFQNISKALKIKGLVPYFATNFLFQGGFTFFTTFSGVFLIDRFGFDQGAIGNYFAYVGIWIAIAQAIIVGRVSSKWNERKILDYSLIGTGIFTLLQFLPTVWWGLLFIVPFFATCIGLSQANIGSLISRSVGPNVQGEILGINASVQALAQTIPPVLSGYIAASIAYSAPLAISGIVIIISGIIFILFAKGERGRKEGGEMHAVSLH